jgi:hypothetical protein
MFGIMFGAPIALGVIADLARPTASATPFLGCLLAAFIFTNIWIAFFRLEIGPDAISYRSFFGGSRRARLADVSAARHAFGGAPYGPGVRVEIAMKRGVEPAKLMINAKVFTRDAIADLQCSLASVRRN